MVMKTKRLVFVFLFALSLILLGLTAVHAADYPKGAVSLKLDGAKMAPVSFPHEVHVAAKVECVKCHHKDADAPKACTTCHQKDAKGNAPGAKDAFHTKCQTCHKDAAAKGAKAPTKCNECHKK
jgi:hypothetical protein